MLQIIGGGPGVAAAFTGLFAMGTAWDSSTTADVLFSAGSAMASIVARRGCFGMGSPATR